MVEVAMDVMGALSCASCLSTPRSCPHQFTSQQRAPMNNRPTYDDHHSEPAHRIPLLTPYLVLAVFLSPLGSFHRSVLEILLPLGANSDFYARILPHTIAKAVAGELIG